MLTNVHHVGIVVNDADEAMKFYRDALGLEVTADRVIEDQGVRGVLIQLGNSEIELLQTTREDTGIARFLASRGEGLHHICFESTDVGADLEAARAKGIELIDQAPRQGLAGMIAFLHPKSNHGVLIEYATPPPGAHHGSGKSTAGFRKFDHLGIVVKDLQAGIATFAANFGLQANPAKGGDVPALGIKNAFLPVGDCDLELIQPTTESGPVADFARDRGEGHFLVSVAVEDAQAAVDHLRALGARAGNPTNGVAFVSARSTHGVNLQLVQR
jgi:methylmalonyl-CoA epimerase